MSAATYAAALTFQAKKNKQMSCTKQGNVSVQNIITNDGEGNFTSHTFWVNLLTGVPVGYVKAAIQEQQPPADLSTCECCGVETPCEFDYVAALPEFTGARPRFYRRAVGAIRWQVYNWRMDLMRNYITGAGGTIVYEESGLYFDAAFANPLPANRMEWQPGAGAGNPLVNASGPLTFTSHYVDYDAADYLSQATEPSVYYAHVIRAEFDGECGTHTLEFLATNQYDNPGAGTWQFIDAIHTITDLDA